MMHSLPDHSHDDTALLHRIPRKSVRTDIEQLVILRLGIFENSAYELVEFRGSSYYPPHAHLSSDTTLHVVFGRGAILLDGQDLPYAAGSTFDVPRGTSHGFRVQEDTLVLSIQNPPILDTGSGAIDFVYDQDRHD